MLTLAQARELVRLPGGMDGTQAGELLDLLMGGGLAPNEGAELLVALAERGETADELAAFVRGLLARATGLPLDGACMDTCGTGGSGLTRFNVSTTVAFVLAAAGVPVAKHGNRGSTRPNGSFDLLDQLGVPYALPPAALARLRRETGVCFLFARAMHPAVAAVAPFRKAAVRRTIFNLAGPLANPCRPQRQVVGVTNERTARVVAGALARLGVARALVVWGEPGIDEFSAVGESRWLTVAGDAVAEGRCSGPCPGLRHEDLPGGDAADNAAVFRRLLAGEERGPLAEMVCLNAGAALDCWHGREPSPGGPGVAQARALLADGAARACYERHVALATSLATAAKA